jgi:hypothetical protein
MGLFKKAKFWEKKDDALGDMSDLGDFGLDDKPGQAAGAPVGAGDDLGLGGDIGAQPMGQHAMPGAGHEMPGPPSHEGPEGSIDAPSSFGQQDAMGTGPAAHATQARTYQDVPQAAVPPMRDQGMHELAKDIEIIHAKLDAIRSSLDSINQRLATLERMASGEGKQRYSW